MDREPVIVDLASAKGTEEIRVSVVEGASLPGVHQEGFRIRKEGHAVTVEAIDETGAMYGTMELAEQIQITGGLEYVTDKAQNPRFPFRAIKFNLPWSSYRTHEAMDANMEVCRDLDFWAGFLDMMAENRFNTLTLWNLHPWPYMIRAKNYPLATPFSDAELDEWKVFWTSLFRMAKERGIETYILNWNVFVSQGFKDNYDAAGQSDNDGHFGGMTDTREIRKYNRESITQVIEEYPDLTGLGVTLGERMQNMNSEQQVDWVEDVFFGGIKAANRPIKFIYRAALKGDHNVHRAAIDNSGLPDPIWVELKFNWSHGHSTPALVKAHGGGTGEEYWTNPAPTKHKMCWMIRNEDFFRLRWGEPDFIRRHIQVNGQDFVGGYFVGSEGYIPAKDIFHDPASNHVNWDYAFQRQWLFYKQWGRLMYDPATSDEAFVAAYDRVYDEDVGVKMIEAFKLASRLPLEVASMMNATWDFTLYSEGIIRGNSDKLSKNFISIDRLIKVDPLEPTYLGIQEFVTKAQEGESIDPSHTTPVELADRLEADVHQALALVNGISTSNPTLQCEIEDVKAWSALSLYFANKIRAAERLATFRITGKQAAKEQAVRFIEAAQQNWQQVSSITSAHIVKGPLPSQRSTHFSWADYQELVDDEVSYVKNQQSKVNSK